MTERILPRYPIFVPSKGRASYNLTAQCLVADGVPFSLVVEPQELEDYRREWEGKPGVEILVLPFSDLGSVVPARNWIKEFATDLSERHWQLDDNIRYFGRRWKGKRLRCDAGLALRVCEDLTDRYENVEVAGLDYYMFVPDHKKYKPFTTNCHVYSCSLYRNNPAFKFRGPQNEDTDYCLQVLGAGYCTILIHAFLVQKLRTMIAKGGNTELHYNKQDGRLKMARNLERRWPGVAYVDRRFQRPQHVVKGQWKLFDTPLKTLPREQWPVALDPEYGMNLKAVGEVKSDYLRRMVDEWKA